MGDPLRLTWLNRTFNRTFGLGRNVHIHERSVPAETHALERMLYRGDNTSDSNGISVWHGRVSHDHEEQHEGGSEAQLHRNQVLGERACAQQC